MEEYTHVCIKPGCGAHYTDNDFDAYYCPTHLAERNAIAAELDANRVIEPDTHVSGLAAYDAAPKIRGFVSAADLML